MSVNRWDQAECHGCRRLRQLFEQQRTYQRRGSVGGEFSSSTCVLHRSFAELDVCSVRKGCVACQVFRRALLLEQLTGSAYHNLVRNGHGTVKAILRCHDASSWLELTLEDVLSPSRAIVALSNSNIVRNNPIIQAIDPLNPQRRARLRDWISRCHNGHLCGNHKYSQRNPTWLLRILPESRIQLISGDDAGVTGRRLVSSRLYTVCNTT